MKNTEVAILRAEISTGHILDENFQVATAKNKIVYTVFSDEAQAVEYVKGVIEIRKDTEFILYGFDKRVLKYIIIPPK